MRIWDWKKLILLRIHSNKTVIKVHPANIGRNRRVLSEQSPQGDLNQRRGREYFTDNAVLSENAVTTSGPP